MASSLFGSTAYVLVKKNEIRVRHIEANTEATFVADPPFTTTRLLVGEFAPAEKLLKRSLKEVLKVGLLSAPPKVVIHPLEMIEGGLSEIEERLLRELALGAGASKVVVWIGAPLSDSEVKAKLNG